MVFLKDKVPAFYLEGMEIQAKLDLYKWEKEKVIKSLRLLNHLLSDCTGKLKEIERQLSGDLRLGVTFIKLPSFLFGNLVLNDKNIKWLKEQVVEYNQCVARGDRLIDARNILVELETWLEKLKKEKTRAFYISSVDIEKKAHTPIVINAKKRD